MLIKFLFKNWLSIYLNNDTVKNQILIFLNTEKVYIFNYWLSIYIYHERKEVVGVLYL